MVRKKRINEFDVVEILESEMKNTVKAAGNHSSAKLQSGRVVQALKAICSLLGNAEPLEITKNLSAFTEACNDVTAYATMQVTKRTSVVAV